ncbi:MAG: MSMEG_0570 family nitrogen starvation response protein [Pseudomonadota bacterium]
MPELRFRVRWPDQSSSLCYSPSTTIRDALRLQQPYTVEDFVQAATAALEQGSRRVAAKYGFGCGQALAQIAEIRQRASAFAGDPDARIIVESFED